MSRRNTWKESLYCVLDEAERDRLGREASGIAVKYREMESRAKADASRTREDLKELREKMDAAAEEAHSGVGRRMVDVYELPLYDRNVVEVRRTDTMERVSVRDMRPEERQLGLLPGAEEAVG